MENEIKSTILTKNNQNNIPSEGPTKKDNNENNVQNESNDNKLEKTKEFLKQLLKESLDKRLTISEKKSRNHIMAINTTLELTNSIKNLAIRMNKQIQEKIKKDKEKQAKLKSNKGGKYKKNFSPRKSAVSSTRISFYRAKTPLHMGKPGNNIRDKSSLIGLKKELIRSKSNIALARSSKATQANKGARRINIKQKNLENKPKSSSNFKKSLNTIDTNLDDLQTLSIISIKTNKTNNGTSNNISNKRSKNKNPLYKNNSKLSKQSIDSNLKNNLNKSRDSKKPNILPQKNNNLNLSEKNLIHFNKKRKVNSNLNTDERKKRRKTPFSKKKNDNESVKIVNNIKKKEKMIEDEINDILSMECNLQKETELNKLNNNDPLLISPLNDLDFVPEGLLKRNSTRNDDTYRERDHIITSFNVQDNLENIKFNHILKYLSINDIIPIKNISKKFHQLITIYLIEFLENEKNDLTIIKDNLEIKEEPNREGIENIILSKGSKKAIQLLNESQLNHLFKEEKLPNYDIILIYRIYFQMINHPFSLIAKNDIYKFWDQCKYYFTNEQNGKTGDILITMINKKKVEINGNNLYQIYNLAKGNFNKIFPNYFSNTCGTTGLFVFVIKDILEFLGISSKIKSKENAFWTYTDIINAINDKINYLKKFKT